MKPVKRKYKISDGTLIQTSDDIISSATRDAVELAPYGITAVSMTMIAGLRTAFNDTPTDNELMGDMIDATAARNTKAEEVRNAIHPIATRIKVKFGEESGKYRGLGIELLSQQDAGQLYRTGGAVVRRSTLYLPDLPGLTLAEINALQTKVGELDTLINTQIDAVKNRDIAVDDRIKKGNELYKAIVDLAEFGKSAWLNVNESKYNDYVINEVQKKAAQVVEGNLASGQIINLSVADVAAITELSAEPMGNSLQIYFSTNPTDYPNGFQQPIGDGNTGDFVAGAIGFAEGVRERLMLYNPGPNLLTYKVVVEA